jgi:hypothetical protein
LNSFLNDIYCKHLFKDGNNKIIENWFEFIRKPSALPIPEVNWSVKIILLIRSQANPHFITFKYWL